MVLLYFSYISLTKVSSEGSHFAMKETGTQKHTQSAKLHHGQPAADRKSCFIFTSVFLIKSKKCVVFGKATICNGKTKGFGTFLLFSLHFSF